MPEKYTVLILEDDRSLADLLEMILGDEGYEVFKTADGNEALKWIHSRHVDLVLQDVRMPKMDGLEFLEKSSHLENRPLSIIITAFSTWENAVQAMRLGAYDFIKKPFDTDLIRTVVRRALEYQAQVKQLRSEGIYDYFFVSDIIGSSKQMAKVFDLVRRVERTDSTILLSGESGTGKELIARAIHYGSSRASHPFIAVNCGAFTESLLESELFGHVRGAFTGAVESRKGLFEIAEKGTLFLDEIGDMSLPIQVKFLRVLETREFMPVGGASSRKADIRFIAATNRTLEDSVKAGSFREDLYYRLNVIPISLPPLRERREDIPLLAGHFLSRFAKRMGRDIRGITDAALRKLAGADWSGNVRELENAIERAVALSAGNMITEDDIKIGTFVSSNAGESHTEEMKIPDEGFEFEKHIENIEKKYIKMALQRTGGNITEAAKFLRMTFRSLRYRIKKLGIDKMDFIGQNK